MLDNTLRQKLQDTLCPDLSSLKGSLIDHVQLVYNDGICWATQMLGAAHPFTTELRQESSLTYIRKYLSVTERLTADWLDRWNRQCRFVKKGLSPQLATRNAIIVDSRMLRLCHAKAILQILVNDGQFESGGWLTVSCVDGQRGCIVPVEVHSEQVAWAKSNWPGQKYDYQVVCDARVPWVYVLLAPENEYAEWRCLNSFDVMAEIYQGKHRLSKETLTALGRVDLITLMPGRNNFGANTFSKSGKRSIIVPATGMWQYPASSAWLWALGSLEHETMHSEDFAEYGFGATISPCVLELRAGTKQFLWEEVNGQTEDELCRLREGYLDPYANVLMGGEGLRFGNLHVEQYFWNQVQTYAGNLPTPVVSKFVSVIEGSEQRIAA